MLERDSNKLYTAMAADFDDRFYARGRLVRLHREIKERSNAVCDRALFLIDNAQYILSPRALDSFAEDFELGYNSGTIEYIKSPIEQIFFIAFLTVLHQKLSHESLGIDIVPLCQYEQNIDGYDYVHDFAFYIDVYSLRNRFKLKDCMFMSSVTIECDGHDYHNKTKRQVSNGNKRSNAMQQSGLTVIHFSGSDLFKYPYQCAEEAYCVIIKKYKKDLKKWLFEDYGEND